MTKEQPLAVRLYFQPPLYELARLIGYAGLPVPEAQERVKAFAEKYGKETMAKAAEEIVRIDESTSPPTARLKDEARKACHQLLGPPPEAMEAWQQPSLPPPPLTGPDAVEEKAEPLPKKKRPRKANA